MEGNGKVSAISSAFVYISVEQSVRPIHVNHYFFDRQSVCLASRGDDLLYVHGIHKKLEVVYLKIIYIDVLNFN
jgi:hypothetical protein